ncbi:MAG: hypothetical protein FWB71_05745 [Defluviitaleaceae bacterium]|nr:hypothetical protein [Defluviitaleaceae bacterium]
MNIPNITMSKNSEKPPKSNPGAKTPKNTDAPPIYADAAEFSRPIDSNDRSRVLDDLRRMREQMEQAAEASREQAAHWRNQRKAMKIAMRIIRGDNVPQQDYDFLLEHNPGLFKLAVSLRDMNNDDPEDHDALSEREGDDLVEQLQGYVDAMISRSSSPDLHLSL